MPVDEHAVHHSTIQPEGFRYGCHNAKRSAGYWAPDGYKMAQAAEGAGVILPKIRWVVDVSSTACRNDNRRNDPGCEGCTKWTT